ncbi:MAG: hypothetical protein RLZZ562_330 [Planctomycetota bacterium]
MTKTKSKTAAKKKPATKPRAAKAAGSKKPPKAAAAKATKKPAVKPAKAKTKTGSASKKLRKAAARVADAATQQPVAAVSVSPQAVAKEQVTQRVVAKPASKSASKSAPRVPTSDRVVADDSQPVAATSKSKSAPRASSTRDAASEWIAAAERAKAAQPVVVPEAQKRPAPAAPIAAPAAAAPTSADSADVDAFLRDCDHPRVAEFEQVRKLILDASHSISEGIKWSAPSFRTEEWFATLHVRDPQKVQVVFHLGAKKSEGTQRVPVGAPEGMVEWLAPDRCMVTVEDVKRRGKALQAFVRAWILHV